MHCRLDEKVALVGGASQGIGAAIAHQLARSGARVIVVARNQKKLEELIENLDGDNHEHYVCDFSSANQVASLAEWLRERPIDIVVNNTGGPPPGLVSTSTTDEFVAAMDMHLLASHRIMQAVLPGMKERHFGRFINIISTSVKIPIAGLGVSNTTRGAMASWAKTLSNEVAQYGITVNNILPGFVETGRLDALIQSKATKAGITTELMAQQMRDEIPAGRFGKARELGFLAAFLASDQAAYITGVSIPVDGGRTGSL